jgi:hypothetical protein
MPCTAGREEERRHLHSVESMRRQPISPALWSCAWGDVTNHRFNGAPDFFALHQAVTALIGWWQKQRRSRT